MHGLGTLVARRGRAILFSLHSTFVSLCIPFSGIKQENQMYNNRIKPRFVRLRDAPFYFGMDRNRFCAEIRPHLDEYRIGIQGIAFCSDQMAAVAEAYKAEHMLKHAKKGGTIWPRKNHRVSLREAKYGTSINPSSGSAFAKAVTRLNLVKR